MKKLALFAIELAAAAIAVADITLDELYLHISGLHIDEVMTPNPVPQMKMTVEADGEVVSPPGEGI